MHRFTHRRVLMYALITVCLVVPIAIAPTAEAVPHPPAPILNLEALTGLQLEKMMAEGTLTSVELTQDYIARIDALNKSGPGLNAVTQWNQDALNEAAASDKRRAAGHLLGPADGLPILMKDLIDVKGMYTSAGNYSLRDSYPSTDSGIVKKMRAAGLVILGKTGLSEFANSFGNQPSGFSNLTGQVINAIDADQNPSGSSSGTGSAMAAALATLGVGTETSGSIISPSQTQGIVGLRPTVGLVPGYGIAPISASQDTAGPMARTVTDVALTLQSISGPDPDSDKEYSDIFGSNYLATGVIPTPPATVPDYLSALDLSFVKGKEIGYNGTLTPGSPLQIAYGALEAAGAIMVPRPVTTVGPMPALPANYEAHKTIDEYYARLGPQAPIKSLVQEVADNQAHAQQALKFGNANHLAESLADITPGGDNEIAYRANLPIRKQVYHAAIDNMMDYTNSDPTQPKDPVIAILGSTPSSPNAGYPQITIPMGYNTTTRRTLSVSVNGNAYDERNLIGVGYVIEQATKLRQPASMVDPSMYRCAHTVPAEPFAARGGCNPDYVSIMKMLGGKATVLPFSLETTSAQTLETKLATGALTSVKLTDAYLYRIARTNSDGPAIQAVRDINPAALAEAKAADAKLEKGASGPLLGIPVLLDDSMDIKGLPTSAGSIALQKTMPGADSTIAAKLKAAGAVILGHTNVTELDGIFDANVPQGYSSLGGQVLVPSDTDKTPAGSSAGSAVATASGLAAITIGMETGTDVGAQLIAPANANGVVGLKPTVGLISRTGVMPVARSQDSPGPIGQDVYDVASALNVLAGADTSDPATIGGPTIPDYTAGLSTGALKGKSLAVVASTAVPFPTVVGVLQSLGAATTNVTPGNPSPNPPSIVTREFKRDLSAFMAGMSGGKSLQQIIDYNNANSVEGLKYEQGQLLAANAVDLSDPATFMSYSSDLNTGKAANMAVIDNILASGPYDAIVVPAGSTLVGIADRAGYPVLTVPVGYGIPASSSGNDPIGVTFIGTAYSEAKLLDYGYALEQAIDVRLAPSYTNPSMWRCVPGSTFFTAELCNPGDRQLKTTGPKLGPLADTVKK